MKNIKKLTGIHHVTSITSNAEKNYQFFTYVLGMRLVKKTINQDDIQTYHLFFADDEGSAGTDITFFDFKGIAKAQFGSNEISRTGFRVPSDDALEYWIKRFDHYEVSHSGIKSIFNRKYINFVDFDGQRYALFSDQDDSGVMPGIPWKKGPVPNEYSIYGLGPVFITVNNIKAFKSILTGAMLMNEIEKEGKYTLFEMGEGGNGATVIVEENIILPPARQGFGSVHHLAFRVDDNTMLNEWDQYLNNIGARTSGYVDRFYFESVYTRLYPGVLFELATDGPGFIDDQEGYETLGEILALPPRFRNERAYVESVVKQFDTVRSTLDIKKEYFNEDGSIKYE